MILVDTHAHIYLEEFQEDIDEVISRAVSSGIKKILMPNIDSGSIESMILLESKYPGICYAMMGLHPCSVSKAFDKQLLEVEEWLSKQKFIAVGEIGTDLYWEKSLWDEQKKAFRYQCELALTFKLPVAIHCRESIDETIEMVKEYAMKGLTGVFHCFTGSIEQASQITGMGFYLGIGGVSTFKNGGMDKVIPDLNLKNIILETDSPYLSPVPFRGKRNEPAKILTIAEKVGEYLQISLEELASVTTENANRLFFRS